MKNCGSCKYVQKVGGHFECYGQKNAPRVEPTESCKWHRLADPDFGLWFETVKHKPPEWQSVIVHIPEQKPLPTVREGFLCMGDKWWVPAIQESFSDYQIDAWMPMPVGYGEE